MLHDRRFTHKTFHHDRALFSRTLESWFIRKIIPIYGRKNQISKSLQFCSEWIQALQTGDRSGLGTSKQDIRAKLVGAAQGQGEKAPRVDVAIHGVSRVMGESPIAGWFINPLDMNGLQHG